MSRDDPGAHIAQPVYSQRLTGTIGGCQHTYWHDHVNHCPGCGRTHWLIGRFSAECAFCRTALALEHSGMLGLGTISRNHHHAA